MASVHSSQKHIASLKLSLKQGYPNPRTGHDRGAEWIPDRLLYQHYVPSFYAAVKAGVTTAMESVRNPHEHEHRFVHPPPSFRANSSLDQFCALHTV